MNKEMVGGLVDFKEKFIFEEFKDQPLHGAKHFKENIRQKYGMEATSDLYTKLINYQIMKYGNPLVVGKTIEFVNNIRQRSGNARRHNNERIKDVYEYQKFIRRNHGSKGV